MVTGVCASGDVHSARAGAAVLAAGGNAVDACVAAGLVACVTVPTMTGLAGGGMFTVRMGDRIEVLDAFANVPGLGAKPREPRVPHVVTVQFEEITLPFQIGASSIAVPGTVAGLWALHERYGRMPLAELAQPAIHAARVGTEVSEGQHKAFALLAEIFALSPDLQALVGDAEGVHPPGATLSNPPIGDVIELLVEDGARAFYEGEIGRKLSKASDGWVTPDDLRSYQSAWHKPLVGGFRDWTLHVPGAPCASGVPILATLGELAKAGALPRDVDPQHVWRVADALAEGERIRSDEAYERRLFEEGYLKGLAATCRSGNTMHCSTADADGNMVAYTTTLGESAGIVIPGTGIALNNFLGEEDIMPKHAEGIVGHRMMTSMCPTIARRDNNWLALGSAGSSRIRSAIPQVLVNHIDRGMRLREAVEAPRIHVEEGKLYVEGHGRREADVHALLGWPGGPSKANWPLGFYFGGVQAVAIGPAGVDAGADEARRGCAIAYP